MTSLESLSRLGYNLAELQAALSWKIDRMKLHLYQPYEKQKLLHAMGKTHRERLLRAGNQQGKSYCGAAEAAIHATGRYPDWWNGRVFPKANNGWAGGVTGEVTRDTVQRLLIGPVGNRGTGLIPEQDIVDVIQARGVADLADIILVKHQGGGQSRIKLKYYEQGREKWQADTVDWLWFDEEPPEDIYNEGLTRTNATGGMAFMTFTPMLGMSKVVNRFLMEKSQDRADINMVIEDAKHISPEQRQIIINSYPAHEREARVSGKPMLGSGLVFPVVHSEISIVPFPIPEHWGKLGGIDFGGSGEDGHPTAAVKIAHDREADIIYVTNIYRKSGGVISTHAEALKGFGANIPFVWPHDGFQRDRGSGEQFYQQYRKCGLNMMDHQITFEDGGNGVEAGLMLMLERFNSGRLRVFSHLTELFDELSLYHRKEGVLVKLNDDLISALRYCIMGLRFARANKEKPPMSREDMLYKSAGRSSGANWMGG